MENWNLTVPDKPAIVEEKSKQLAKFSSGASDSINLNKTEEEYFLQIIPKKQILYFSKVKQIQGEFSNSFECLVNYNATGLEETEQDATTNDDTTDQNSEDDGENVANEKDSASKSSLKGCPEKHEECGKQFTNFVVSCNVDQLFKMMFTDSKFIRDFHSDRGTTDVIQTEWIVPEKKSDQSRTLTFIALTGQRLGPKHAHVTESQTLMQGSEPGSCYAVNSESVNEGIPCADAFSVNCHYCLSAVSESETKLMVFGKVLIKRNVWTKNLIERNTMAALEDYFKQLEAAIIEECVKLKLNNEMKLASVDSVCRCSCIQEFNNRSQQQGILDASNQRLLLIVLLIMVLINGYLLGVLQEYRCRQQT